MGSILDDILDGGIPNLEALRGHMDDSLAARDASIQKGIECLDDLYEQIGEGDDMDSQALRLMIQGARLIQKASYTDIRNAAPEADRNAPHLSGPVRDILAEAMKGCLHMVDAINGVAAIREQAVDGFKSQMRTPSYAEQRQRRDDVEFDEPGEPREPVPTPDSRDEHDESL